MAVSRRERVRPAAAGVIFDVRLARASSSAAAAAAAAAGRRKGRAGVDTPPVYHPCPPFAQFGLFFFCRLKIIV